MANQWKAHCLVVAYPGQGHINPMLQFSKRLEHHGVKVTLVTTLSFWKSLPKDHKFSNSLSVEFFSDGYDEGLTEEAKKSPTAHVEKILKIGPQSFYQLLERLLISDGCSVDCVIYDSFLPWALDVAKKFGLFCASFLTQSCAVNSIYYHLHLGVLKLPITESKILLPEIPELEPSDLPGFLYKQYGAYLLFWDLLVNTFSNIEKADFLLSNSVYEMEPKVVDWMRKIWPLMRTIGPTLPSMFLDKKIQDDYEYGINMFKPNTDLCLKWLQDKPKTSVVYVSFGSVASFNEEQMDEIAWGLIDSKTYFLWVVRESEEHKLPKKIREMILEKGLIVTWCPQLQVLSHESVGCFVTHCGWNSTLEGVSLGVPMIVVPDWSDQPTNAKYIVDVWKMGIKPTMDENGIIRRGMLKHCIKEVMEDGKGNELKNNAFKLKDLIRTSINDGGSSDKNITEFVEKIITH